VAFNVDEFRSKALKYGGAAPNLFEVDIVWPWTSSTRTNYNIKTTFLPASISTSATVNYLGRVFKFAGERTYPQWTCTFLNDEDFKIAFLVFILFIISVFVLSSILSLDNINFENAFKLSILTLTNTVTSSLYGLDDLSFFDLNSLTKMSLIIFMIIGRIEVIVILFLIKKFIFRK